MERLTTRLSDGNYIPKALCTIARDGEVDDVDGCNECCDSCNGECSVCAIQKCFNKLAEYEDLDEQDLLLRLPCKVGSTLYQPIYSSINEYKVIGLCFDIHHNKWMYEVAYGTGFEWHKTVCYFNDIGKTVFLTQAEAERKLKEMGVIDMTIDEAIAMMHEWADYECYNEEQIQASEAFNQIAEWLEELKIYRQHEVICHNGYNAGYNKAIDEFTEKLIRISDTLAVGNDNTRKYLILHFKEIAEQLKAGEENVQKK